MDGAGAMDNLRLPTTPWKALRSFHTAHSLMISSDCFLVLGVRLRRTWLVRRRNLGI